MEQLLSLGKFRYSRRKHWSAHHVRYVRDIDSIDCIPANERESLKKVSEHFPFRTNGYYLDLIDWTNPDDPIRKIVVPKEEELSDYGKLDPCNEQAVTVARGIQHKYTDTAILLCTEVCGSNCRYCFRKRLFMDENDEAALDCSEGIEYIANHPEINNVLMTGGDPLILNTDCLTEILQKLRDIPHVKIIRIGSKMPAFNPWRILNDPDLQDAFQFYSTDDTRIYLMTHFDHPNELTEPAIECIATCLNSGLVCANQSPLIRGVNDDPHALAELYHQLSLIGCPPYYLFQMRPTAGNQPYAVPIVEGWDIYNKAMQLGSGLARRARFVMSHETGKLEILAVDERFIYMRYHQAKDPENLGRFMAFKRDNSAYWLDDLELAFESSSKLT